MSLPIIVFHSGIWKETNCYVNYKIVGVLVDDQMDFEDFLSLIVKEVGLNPSTHVSIYS